MAASMGATPFARASQGHGDWHVLPRSSHYAHASPQRGALRASDFCSTDCSAHEARRSPRPIPGPGLSTQVAGSQTGGSKACADRMASSMY